MEPTGLIFLNAPFLCFLKDDTIVLNENRLKGIVLSYLSTNNEGHHLFEYDAKYKENMDTFESFISDLEGEWFLNPYGVSIFFNQEMFSA